MSILGGGALQHGGPPLRARLLMLYVQLEFTILTSITWHGTLWFKGTHRSKEEEKEQRIFHGLFNNAVSNPVYSSKWCGD